MADDVPEYEPHLLSDADRDSLRTVIDLVRNDNGWATRLERALDSEHYWRKRASKPTADDSELQGELDVLREASDQRYWHSQHLHLARMYNAAHGHIDAINRGEFAGPTLDVKCQQLADALTAERAKVAELQSELADAKREAEAARLFVETQTAANARRAEESQLEPVGWLGSSGNWRNNNGGWDFSMFHPPESTRRRLYFGPAEPLDVTP